LTLHILQHKGTTFLRWEVGEVLPESLSVEPAGVY
jgi:hypothetical protein